MQLEVLPGRMPDAVLSPEPQVAPLAALAQVRSHDLSAAAATHNTNAGTDEPKVRFAWLEITGQCQLECGHCYAESSPRGTHGTMTDGQWVDIIDQLAGAGIERVQFIGGEPTLHPGLPTFIGRALSRGMGVEVYSNLSHVTDPMWDTLSQEGVSLATSYYSPDAGEHEAITKGRGSHRRTRANIQEALRRDIPLRVGIIGVNEEQNVRGAIDELVGLGVDARRIGVDYLRQVGRGVRDQEPSTDQLCGHCADGKIAIMADGSVQPCVFTRWDALNVGNVQEQTVQGILGSDQFALVRGGLEAAFAGRRQRRRGGEIVAKCNPKDDCSPIDDDSDAQCTPDGVCAPYAAICKPDAHCNPYFD